MTTIKQQAIAGIKWSAVSAIFSTAIQIIRAVVLGRLLLPRDFGLMAIVLVVTGFVSIFSEMGLSDAVIQKSKNTKYELSSLYWGNIAFGIFVYIVIIIATPYVAVFYEIDELNKIIPIISISFIYMPFGSQVYALLQKHLMFNKLSYIDIFSSFVGIIVSIFLAISKFGVWALVWGQLCESAIKTLCLCCIGLGAEYRPILYFSLQDMSGYLRFGLSQVGSMVLNYINLRSDQLAIGVLLGPEVLGYYSMAFNLVMLPVLKINPVVTRVAFPVFVRFQNDHARLKSGYLRMLRLLTTINAPVLLGFAAVAPLLIPLVLGEQWRVIAPLVQILCVFSLIRSTGNPGGALVLAVGRADIELYWNLCLFFLIPFVVTCSALIWHSIYYVAFSLVFIQVVLWYNWYFFVIRKIVGSMLFGYFSSVAKPIAMSFFMFTVVYSFLKMFNNVIGGLYLCIAGVIVGVCIYLLVLYMFAKDDIVYLKEIIL